MNIPEDKKNKIIQLFCNTHKKMNKILQEVAPNGELTMKDIYDVLNEFNKNNGEAIKRKQRRFLSKDISDEEIFELKERKMSTREIIEYFEKQNKVVNAEFINSRCRVIYKKKGKKNPAKPVEITEEMEEEIFNLREQRYLYEEIEEHFAQKGINISSDRIRNRCKKIYSQKGLEMIDLRKNENISDNEILQLREQGFSYERIEKYYKNKGILVSKETINRRCEEIYAALGKKEPNLLRKISNEDIFNLREQGYTYKDIANYFNKEKFVISYDTVRNRCKIIYREKRLQEPRGKRKQKKIEVEGAVDNGKIDLRCVDKSKLKREIENLMKTKGATHEQVKAIAKLYDLDIEEEKEK